MIKVCKQARKKRRQYPADLGSLVIKILNNII